MRFATVLAEKRGKPSAVLVARDGGDLVDLSIAAPDGPQSLLALIQAGPEAMAAAAAAASGAGKDARIDPAAAHYMPLIPRPPKMICLGLNYVDHAAEGGFEPPKYPTLFMRGPTSLVGHGAPIVRPSVCEQLDYEAELVAIIGTGGRHIAKQDALDHVIGYSVFNDASIRAYQRHTPQWTMGKNFDGTGAFGPEFVSADEVPPGADGLSIQCRLNGQVVQNANTRDMIFDVATTIAFITEGITLEPGDVLVMGTPSGVGHARTPQLWMKPGDRCEVEIEGIGLLSNPIVAEEEAGGTRFLAVA